ncbi:glycosyl hydrolase [Micromonospora purpureochromogenes]|uniref:glycoside hydrolase family 26 protein n=1 Tax=Micromonospora purpureochromogenes TaxID=47872 RepID=UPI0033FCC90E
MAKLTVPRVMTVLIAALLLAYAFAMAPKTTAEGRKEAPSNGVAAAGPSAVATAEPGSSLGPDRKIFPPAGKTFIGVMTQEGPHDFTAVNMFTAASKHQPQVMLFGSGWASDAFDRTPFDRIKNRGMLPMLGWEPWDYRLGEAAIKKGLPTREVDRLRNEQTRYRLSHIARGDFDSYLRSWAEGIKSLGYPVAIRFAHEMNGYWYPWCEMVNGNRPGDYVKAWRHVHDLFRAAGATNVTWVWSPNNIWDDSLPKLSTFYPGDAYVDWVGISGYYTTVFTSDYRPFDVIFDRVIKEIRALSSKPLVITETGASDAYARKAEWITQTFRLLPRYKDVIGVIWFEVNKEREVDWRIVSSPAVAKAFAKGVADPRYQVTWSPDMLLRTKLED